MRTGNTEGVALLAAAASRHIGMAADRRVVVPVHEDTRQSSDARAVELMRQIARLDFHGGEQ